MTDEMFPAIPSKVAPWLAEFAKISSSRAVLAVRHCSRNWPVLTLAWPLTSAHPTSQSPLIARKSALEAIIIGPGVVRYSEHFEEDGERLFRHACRLGLEGVISKLRNAPYRSGRSKDWTKSKCANRQEFVVAGYVPSTVSNTAIGSLVLGYYDDGKLIHVGRVGTGFSHKLAEDLFRRLDAMRIPKSPFAKKLSALDARRARFVRPELVAEVKFRSWTNDGLIRHSSFLGLREDKLAEEVVLESEEAARAKRGQ